MPKTKKIPRNNRAVNFYQSLPMPFAIVLVGLSILVITVLYQSTRSASTPSVSVGSMGYQIVDDKAVKRTDASVQTLKQYLDEKAANEGCPSKEPAYEHVAAYTQDETQVLLKYGCGGATSSMHLVKKSGAWASVSPTNQFDNFDIPSCKYLDENSISKEIAPVCVNGLEATSGTLTYSVRE